MTALAGYWSFGESGAAGAACDVMLRAQASYGPGAPRQADLGGLAVGRRLFSLLPEDAHDIQPIVSADERFGLVADVRLDNREDLIRALGIVAAPSTAMSDSAILFAALMKWGEAALDHIFGDFAFAWFDRAARRLMLGRDPLGQRPLFWHRGTDFVAFASMPSGLHALDGIVRRPNLDALSRFVALLPAEGDASYFEQVHRIQPGHLATITPEGATSRRYWTPRRRDLRLGSFENYVEAFRSHLDQAVEARLRGADRLVASHLSGGWDSSAVTATAARLVAPSGGQVIALTSVPRLGQAAAAPSNRFADEGPLAAATARRYANVEHVLVDRSAHWAIAEMDEYHAAFQRPPFNLLNHSWLAEIRTRARSRGARILLTGEIGNWTISASPNSILADFIRQGRWVAWSREASAMLTSRRARLRGVVANSFGPWLPDFLWKSLGGLSAAPTLADQSALHPRLAEHMRRAQQDYEMELATRPKDNFENTVRALYEMDFGEYRKGILGGWGIDKRDATADVRLLEFCLSLPIEMLADRGVRRPLARAALSDCLPDEVLNESRKGYQAGDWHEGMTMHLPAIAALIEAIARDDAASSLVDVGRLRQWLRDWPTGGWERLDVIGRYRTALPQALNAGAFAIAASRKSL